MVLYEIGVACKNARKRNGKTQASVATSLGCTVENISAFEHGRNNNAIILFYYLSHFNAFIEIQKLVKTIPKNEVILK